MFIYTYIYTLRKKGAKGCFEAPLGCLIWPWGCFRVHRVLREGLGCFVRTGVLQRLMVNWRVAEELSCTIFKTKKHQYFTCSFVFIFQWLA